MSRRLRATIASAIIGLVALLAFSASAPAESNAVGHSGASGAPALAESGPLSPFGA